MQTIYSELTLAECGDRFIMGRLFVAAELDSSAEKHLSEVTTGLIDITSRKIRWVPPENWHLTLTFIGEVDDQHTLLVADNIRYASEGILRFIVKIDELITLPNEGNPRILALKVLDESRWLSCAKRRLEARLADLGLEIESRAFSPHITIGRMRDKFISYPRSDLGSMKRFVAQIGAQRVVVNGLSLISSLLTSEGPVYRQEEVITFLSKEHCKIYPNS